MIFVQQKMPADAFDDVKRGENISSSGEDMDDDAGFSMFHGWLIGQVISSSWYSEKNLYSLSSSKYLDREILPFLLNLNFCFFIFNSFAGNATCPHGGGLWDNINEYQMKIIMFITVWAKSLLNFVKVLLLEGSAQ